MKSGGWKPRHTIDLEQAMMPWPILTGLAAIILNLIILNTPLSKFKNLSRKIIQSELLRWGFQPRYAFGSQKDKDRCHNTPRAWDIQRFLQSRSGARSKEFLHSLVPKAYRKITTEDAGHVLSVTIRSPLWSLWSRVEITTADVPFGPIGPVKQLSYSCAIANRSRQVTSGYPTAPCLTIQPFLSLLRSQQRQTTCQYDGQGPSILLLGHRLIVGLADAHSSSHVGDLDDYQKDHGLGHEMIGRVDRALAKGLAVDSWSWKSSHVTAQEATDQLWRRFSWMPAISWPTISH